MILRRALGGYEILIENGSFRTAPTDYPIGEPAAGITIIQTSRMIPLRLVDVVRSHFDPLGFESTRAFGRKLACAALATFFEAERKPRK
ncbi:VirC2 protein [Ensifer sp. YR511]|nr:VirC2 protein [Ensifer sp. YR511]